MSEALFLTFQSQLSVVMETVLKSAMFEITRLVEDSFLKEVGQRKQEVEVLKRRLQLSESKLRERDSRDESQPVETVRVIHSESTSDFKPTVSNLDKSNKNFTLDKEMDSNPSRLLQSPKAQDAHKDLPASSPNSRVKTETELDLLPVKEEEEMVPVWDSVNRDDGCHAEMADPSQGELRGPCDQEEIQVESFPGLNSLDIPDATSYFTPYSVSTLVHQGIRAQHSHLCTTELMLSSIPERSHSFVQPENGQSYPGSKGSVLYSHIDVCPSEKAISHAQYPQRFSQDKHGTPEQIHAERSHHCTQCGKKFVRACDLKAHSLIHKGKKPLSCSQCDQTFAYNFELKAHQRNHSGERPHVCPHCGKAFARMSNFRQHQNIHTREKLFSCAQCGMRFNRATNLRVHLRRHSYAGKTYNCPFCGKSFLNPRQMKAHLLKVHGRGGK
uniref:C2H2-type domain-containing protein n=1 Tax=Cyprinus carpio carpio TaxID=630221 RepID=A0A9J7XJ42_CYPCA